MNVDQVRLRMGEETPLIKQADTVALIFKLLAVPNPQIEEGAELGEEALEVVHPEVERRAGVDD